MHPISKNCSLVTGILIILFSICVFLINHQFFHFQGNNYLPQGAGTAGISILLTLIGVRVYLEKTHYICELMQAVLSLYLVMGVIALLTNAVQFTPFTPVDRYLIAIDRALGVNTALLIEWTSSHPWFQYILAQIYDTLPLQMAILPLAVAASGKFHILREYFCLMLVSALIGFVFYYFFPTTAPANNIDSPWFGPLQQATGIKFSEIHHHLTPSTIEGGMIALPSFHTIWAWFCIYLVRSWFYALFIILPLNLLLIISCVLLGWHYFVDLIGSVLVIITTHTILNLLAKKS